MRDALLRLNLLLGLIVDALSDARDFAGITAVGKIRARRRILHNAEVAEPRTFQQLLFAFRRSLFLIK